MHSNVNRVSLNFKVCELPNTYPVCNINCTCLCLIYTECFIFALFSQTRFDDSVLFYASGEDQKFHHISVSIQNGTVVVEVDLGDDGPINATLGQHVNCNKWFNLTISHRRNEINISLNDIEKTLYIEGSLNFLYIDPEIYIGGGPELHKKKGQGFL